MYKLLLVSLLLLSGCSHFSFNATMCNEIASDPHATVPEECRVYDEDKAKEALDASDEKSVEISEIIEFNNMLETNTTKQSKEGELIEFSKE